nr:protein TRANSPORT INHIBITOR RESPONSE 1-like isoform X2 [Halyomorpha halys]
MTDSDVELIDTLPDEILEAVFKCLPLGEVKTKLAVVCKRWYEVSKSCSLLRRIEFGPFISTEVAVQVLRQAPLLNSLKLLSRTDINELLNEVAVWNTKLERLKVYASKDARYTEVEGPVLIACVHSLRNLKDLTLKRVTFDNPDHVFKELGPATCKLQALNLNHSIQLDTDGLFNLVRGLPKLKELRIYCISFNRIGSVTPYTDPPVEDLIRKMNSLQVLKLNMLGITGAIFQALSMLPNLKVLHLYRMVMVQDESMSLMARLKRLEKLVVTIPRTITSQCWSEVLGSTNMVNLSTVVISNSYSVDDMVLRTIAENCPAIVELGFPGCRGITDAGVAAIIIKCTRLVKINLFSTKSIISEAFRLLPVFLPHLEELIYRAVDRTDTGFPEEVRSMPNLRLMTIYRYP